MHPLIHIHRWFIACGFKLTWCRVGCNGVNCSLKKFRILQEFHAYIISVSNIHCSKKITLLLWKLGHEFIITEFTYSTAGGNVFRVAPCHTNSHGRHRVPTVPW